MKKGDDAFLNLTSLMDVLMILLFFLLMSYNPTELEISPLDGIVMPQSDSLDMGAGATVVQVNTTLDIFIEKDRIGNLGNEEDMALLSKRLAEVFAINKEKLLRKDPKKTSYKNINFILDGKVAYENLEKIMTASAQSGFENYKFMVVARKKK